MSKLKQLFTTKAFILALLGTAAAVGGVYGFNVPVAQIMAILTPIMIAIGAAGWSDAVQMKAKMALEHEVKMHALNAGLITHAELLAGKSPTPRPVAVAQAGFINIGMLFLLSVIAAVALLLVGCGVDCKDPKNASDLKCKIDNALVDCTGVSSLTSAVEVVTPLVENIVKSATNPDGSINWSSVEQQGLQLSWQYGICVVAQVWGNLFGGKAESSVATMKLKLHPQRSEEAKASFDRIRQKVAPGYTIKLQGGGAL